MCLRCCCLTNEGHSFKNTRSFNGISSNNNNKKRRRQQDTIFCRQPGEKFKMDVMRMQDFTYTYVHTYVWLYALAVPFC